MSTYSSKQEVWWESIDNSKILNVVQSKLTDMQNARHNVEETWLESWAQYLATSEAQSTLRNKQLQTVGNVNVNWRHRIDRGKAFEIVETIHSYLMSACFPNENWFDLVPVEPSDTDSVRAIRNFMKEGLRESEFDIQFDLYLRQYLITGNSCMYLEWCEEEQKIEYEVVNVFDCWLDTNEPDPMNSPVVRRFYLSKGDLQTRLENGEYTEANQDIINSVRTKTFDNLFTRVQSFQGINAAAVTTDAYCELYEYWGDITLDETVYRNCVVTFINGTILRIQDNTNEFERPFVWGNYIPVVGMPYGISPLQSSLGLIHTLNILTNQRLDGIEITTNPMWTKKLSSSLLSEDIYSEPGHIFEVDEHDDLRPFSPSQFNIEISYQEANATENAIDKNAGTGPLVGTGSVRAGERVTAAEIGAIREAGGNRLTGIHRRLERRSLLPILSKTLQMLRQCMSKPKVTRLAGAKSGEYNYMEVAPADLRTNVKAYPLGANHVIEKKRVVQDIVDFMTIVAKVPQAAEMLDYEAIVLEIMRYMPFDEPMRFLKKQEEAPQTPVEQVGGVAGQNAVNQEIATDGGNKLINQMAQSYGQPSIDAGVDPTGQQSVTGGVGDFAGGGTGLTQP